MSHTALSRKAAYRARNAKKIRAYQAAYYARNAEKIRAQRAKRLRAEGER